MRPFQPFRPFAIFRSQPPAATGGDPPDPGDIPANALITTDGVALQTADGNYLTTGS